MARKKILLFPLIALLFSCSEDAQREIQTNLPVEASQLLQTSNAWGENLYFSMLKYGDYEALEDKVLPGCPSIRLFEESKTVELDFTNKVDCEIVSTKSRKGKILLNYGLNFGSNAYWILKFEDYEFGDVKISGFKTFSQKGLNTIQETFENLTLETQNGLTTQLNGSFTHVVNRTLFGMISISSTGMAEGKNAAGRAISLRIDSPRLTSIPCLNEGKILPRSGKEAWEISREPGEGVLHRLEYQGLDSCQVEVMAVLPDGRQLFLNP